jgi:integrase/recombinase XerD
MANPTVWIIRIYKIPGVGWKALKPIFSTRSGKPILTQRCLYKGAEIDTPGGRWEIEWCEGNKRKRQKCSDHVSDVLKAKARQELKLQAQAAGIAVVDTKAEKGKRLLATVKDEYLAECKANKAPKTYQAAKQALDNFTTLVGRKHLEDITRADCLTKFVTHLRESDLADRTVFHRVALLVTFLKWANHRIIGLKDAPSYVETEIRCYTADDLTKLFAACTPEERLLFRFFLGTGCREQEVQHAETTDLLNDCQTLLVQEKRQWGFKPKGRRERRIPMPDSLAVELKEHIKTLKGTLLFPAVSGEPDGHLLRRLKAVAKRAKLTATYGKWTLHIFRHTFCTMHLQNGLDVRTLMRWAGHENLETTQKYLDYLNAHDAEARRLVNSAFATTFAVVPPMALAEQNG